MWNVGSGRLGRRQKQRDLEGEREIKRVIEEVNVIKVFCMPVWKCHNETHYFVQLMYTNKITQFG